MTISTTLAVSSLLIITTLLLISSFIGSVSSIDSSIEDLAPQKQQINPQHGLHACFSPDTNLSIVEHEMMTSNEDNNNNDNNHKRYEFMGSKWTTTASGTNGGINGKPVTLTWSIAPDGVAVSGGYGEPAAPSNLIARLTQIFGSQTAYLNMLNQAFGVWSSVAGIKFVYEPHDDGSTKDQNLPGQLGVRGDIRFFGHRIDGDYGVLAYTSAPDSGDMVIDTGDVYFDQNKDWIYQIIGHEIGHALGLSHSCPMDSTKLMEPLLNTNFVGPQLDDILGAHLYYGDRFEPNDQTTSAHNVGTFSSSSSNTISTVSLHSSSDVDIYQFTAGASMSVTITVSPAGKTYTTGAVGTGVGSTGGACGGTFPSVDTNRVFNLQLQILDGSGNVVASSNTGSLGSSESLTVSVTSGRNYYVKVFAASSSTTGVQVYNLGMTSTAASQASPAASTTPSHSKAAATTPAASTTPSHSKAAAATPAASTTPSHSKAAAATPAASTTPSHSKAAAPSPSSRGCGSSFCIKKNQVNDDHHVHDTPDQPQQQVLETPSD